MFVRPREEALVSSGGGVLWAMVPALTVAVALTFAKGPRVSRNLQHSPVGQGRALSGAFAPDLRTGEGSHGRWGDHLDD